MFSLNSDAWGRRNDLSKVDFALEFVQWDYEGWRGAYAHTN